MFALQIVSLTGQQSKPQPSRNVFLEIYSEGQPSRRFIMGKFGEKSNTEWYDSIIHLTSGSITLRLSYGVMRYHYIGTHILLDFLHKPEKDYFNSEKQLIFAKKQAITYILNYTIKPIEHIYRFALNEIVCLNQLSNSKLFYNPKDFLSAEVEFNSSSNSVDTGPKNVYKLGSYFSFDIGPIHIMHNLNFSTLTPFKIIFYAKNQWGPAKQLGTLTCIPLIFISKKRLIEVLEISSINPEKEDFRGMLFFIQPTGGAPSRQIILSQMEDSKVTQQVILSSYNGGSYEFTFNLTKETIENHLGTVLEFVQSNSNFPGQLNSDFNEEGNTQVTTEVFMNPTDGNQVKVLIDGRDTFASYYQVMMQAQHSIKILAWELTLTFGLVLTKDVTNPPSIVDPQAKWITLEDVLIERAMNGVSTQIIVWRHRLSYVTRYLFLGEVSIEAETAKLEKRCLLHGVTTRIIHTIDEKPENLSSYSKSELQVDIVIIIVGSPKNHIIASHHEKLLLVDAECPNHSVAFIGGFDIAKGRYDQPAHQVPKPLFPTNQTTNQEIDQSHYSGSQVQPFIRAIRFLWHDLQILIRGKAVQQLHFHFLQRLDHALTSNSPKTRSKKLTVSNKGIAQNCQANHLPFDNLDFTDCQIRLLRTWKGVFDTHYMFHAYCEIIMSAKKYLYFEHQYPFQNYHLTRLLCQALERNPELKVIILSPIKSDLPSGLVGEFVDWSQDHIINHLLLIKQTAPKRVGIYGLIRQENYTTKRLKQIYIHAKVIILDDACLVIGSTNLDNISFFYSSELVAIIPEVSLAVNTKVRLVREHLGRYFKPEMEKDFDLIFETFRQVALQNDRNLHSGLDLVGRPVFMDSQEKIDFLREKLTYPNQFSKFLWKMGINTEDLIVKAAENQKELAKYLSLFGDYIKSKARPKL